MGGCPDKTTLKYFGPRYASDALIAPPVAMQLVPRHSTIDAATSEFDTEAKNGEFNRSSF
jgi:hypothetical protein